MENIDTLLTAGIFFIAFLALLLSGFRAMLSPLKDNQARMEKVLTDIQKVLAQNQQDLAENHRALEENHRALEDNKQHINRVESEQKNVLSMIVELTDVVTNINKRQNKLMERLAK